jgi:hypothetical protein
MNLKKISKRNILVSINVLLVFSLIFLTNIEFLPIENEFIFLVIVLIVFSLAFYQLKTAFSFLVGLVVLENVNLAPTIFQFNLRPYQLLAGIIFSVIILKIILAKFFLKENVETKKNQVISSTSFWLEKITFPKFIWWLDGSILIFLGAGFLSNIFSQSFSITSFQPAIVVVSFGIIYFITRIIIQNFNDLKENIPFFFSASLIIVLYGIWQNWQFGHLGQHFQVMAGRPNATFSEPNWLGNFLVFFLVSSLVIFFSNFLLTKKTHFRLKKCLKLNWFLYLTLTLTFLLLILTMARSAWLGAVSVLFFYFLIVLFFTKYLFGEKFLPKIDNFQHSQKTCVIQSNKKNKQSNCCLLKKLKLLNWKTFFQQIILIFSSGILAIILIYFFNLTNFEVANRLQSTGSGYQEITIACLSAKNEQESLNLTNFLQNNQPIHNLQELEKYRCWHINLEEIANEKAQGHLVAKIYRTDPTINIRGKIYQKSWQEIQQHLILGIGWGEIGKILGEDENGTILNSSNIFLEIWLGAGIFGLLAFVILIGGIFWQGMRLIISSWQFFNHQHSNSSAQHSTKISSNTTTSTSISGVKDFSSTKISPLKIFQEKQKMLWGMFLILGLVAIIIPNLFNAGILLGFIWLFFGLAGLDFN